MKKFFIYKIIIIFLIIFFSQQSKNVIAHYSDSSYDDTDRDDNDNNLQFCKNEGPLNEYIYYIYEKTHNFNTWVNKDNAHYLVEMAKNWNCYKDKTISGEERLKCKNKYNEAYYKYLNRLGPYFFFVAFAGVVFFTWILLWVCMLYPKCCCKERPNERYLKYLSLIIVLICLGGIFACIISSFVYSHRWNNRLNGITCAIERLYYNMYYGQKNYRKGSWRGFNGMYYVLCKKYKSKNICQKLIKNNPNNKINENNFVEDKKNFRLLEEKKFSSSSFSNDISSNSCSNDISRSSSYSNEIDISSSTSDISSSSNSDISSSSSYSNNIISSSSNSNINSNSFSNDICRSNSNSNDIISSASDSSSFSSIWDTPNSKEYEDEVTDGSSSNFELNKTQIMRLANSFKQLKPKLFNFYYKVRRTLKGLGYYGYFAIYSVLFVIITLLVLPQVFFVFYPDTMCKHYNRILLIVGWNCLMLFTLYSFFLTAFLGMVDYASTDMIGFFYHYFKPENLIYEYFKNEKPFLIPNELTGEILFFCLYMGKDELMLNYDFYYLRESSQYFDYYKNIYSNYIDIYYKKFMNKNDNNKEYNIDEQLINKELKNNLRNLGRIDDPDWEDDEPDINNTKCSYLINDINMLYTTFYSFSKMDRNLIAITATISFLGYICVIFMVLTITKFESYWKEKGNYNYNGNNNDNDNSSSDGSSDNNVKKNNNKKIGNYIKVNENLKKNLIDPNTIHKKKSFDNKINSDIDNEEEEDEEE